MQIGSLFMALGFDVDDKKLDEFNGKITALRGGLASVSGVAAAGVGALSAMTLSAVKTGQTLSNVSLQTLQSTEDIQRLANVASGVNPFLSWEQSLAMIDSVFQTIVDVEWGEGATGSLALMGIDATAQKSVKAMIDEFRRAYQDESSGLSQGRKIRLLQEGGLPKDFLAMVTESESRYNELFNRDISFQDNDIEKLKAVNAELQEISYQYDYIINRLGVMFSDSFTDLLVKPWGWFADQNIKIIEGLDARIKGENNPNSLIKNSLDNKTIHNRAIESIDLGVSKMEARNIARQWLGSTTSGGTVNNIYIEGTADPRETAESLFDALENQKNRELSGETPNSAYGGIR